MTEPTTRIADVMLHNSVNVMLRQKEEHDIPNYPLFTHRGVEFSRQSLAILRHRTSLRSRAKSATTRSAASFFTRATSLGAVGRDYPG